MSVLGRCPLKESSLYIVTNLLWYDLVSDGMIMVYGVVWQDIAWFGGGNHGMVACGR